MAEDVLMRTTCRACLSTDLSKVLDLGSTPPANAFLKKEDLTSPERQYPLQLLFCNNCKFVQLSAIVSPDILFRDYVYVSSTSPVFVKHFEDLADEMIAKFRLAQNSLIVDIGSNDGILLKPLKAKGMRVLGVDPAVKIAEEATKSGVPTRPEYFAPELARNIVSELGKAKMVSATSAFPHIDDLDAIAEGAKTLLDEDGVFLIEAYYLKSLLEKNLFDTVYHEHLSYFTVMTARVLFERLGLEIFDVVLNETHGGSLRMLVQKKGGPRKIEASVANFIESERAYGTDKKETFTSFADRIKKNKDVLKKMLADLKTQGKTIAAYGAPAKGNTLLNYFNIGPDTLEYVVDDSPWKQGLYTPGMHIPVVGAEEISRRRPDYLLILAWNFSEPIMRKQSAFHDAGGKFIVPAPKPVII